MKKKVLEIVHKAFKPEFLNRLDQILVYRSLNKKLIEQIIDLQLAKLTQKLKKQGIGIILTTAMKAHLADIGFDPVFGARPLKRAIQDTIIDELALELIENKLENGSRVTVDYKNGKMQFSQPN